MNIKPLSFFGGDFYRYKILLRKRVVFMYTLRVSPSDIIPILSKNMPILSYTNPYQVYGEGWFIGKIKKMLEVDGDITIKKLAHNPYKCKYCDSWAVIKHGFKKLKDGSKIQMLKCKTCKKQQNVNMSQIKILEEELMEKHQPIEDEAKSHLQIN